MIQKIISWIANNLFIRIAACLVLVIFPVTASTSWVSAAFLNSFTGANFLSTLFGLLFYGWVAALPAFPLLYITEKWIIRDRAIQSRKWVIVRLLFYMLHDILFGTAIMLSIRAGMDRYPPLVEAIYYLQLLLVIFTYWLLYTLVERTIYEIQKREAHYQQQIADLRIEIDRLRQQANIEEITSTDFFQELQRRAAQMRQRTARAR